ncbi:hypothetical protein P8625_06920 [Tenacibaculum tangerinum]|uniref:Bacteriocin n=1 Tax=Tenacibaculum tangerinum TaxID=3038772 RepID=A0ABY8L649_9FLAO|nr:hypothetical protein [Tenacibaculum tangerinum]WGH76868.1 hypothetical protein P8625_06920 [Tenacibaculum tangerinum]
MKKSILILGKVLNKKELRKINGKLGNTCDGPEKYYVNNCRECINTILPGAPTFCFNNCCVMAY